MIEENNIITKKIKLLHFASFIGNNGDNVNHFGQKYLFNKFLQYQTEVTQLEIRDFYRGNRKFDDQFINLINDHDLTIIGGGNYFELWPNDSRSGTSIDLGIDQLKKIVKPVLFYSLGVDIHQGVSEENKKKFFDFISYLSENNNFFLSVRNDGAMKNLRTLYGEMFSQKFHLVPDGGFYARHLLRDNQVNLAVSKETVTIGINLAGDMLDSRFNDFDSFINNFSTFLNELFKEGKVNVIFFNHIPRDVYLSTLIFEKIKERYQRENFIIAPYFQGENATIALIDYYKKCDIILANRFHANVLSLSYGIPTIGLINYPQISNLYEELGLQEYSLDINESNFFNKLKSCINLYISDKNYKLNYIKKLNDKISLLDHQTAESYMYIRNWLNKKL